ncbi:E3 ubiquitin-protein ligase [Canna indica]|uniref:E3 ubiquitin-protein ligase n=1 Tax=Canna indica TaxID=4628 RepID=A0AAQ3QNZ1_9LILI|nr:E3 ubiquitin-protein ligase [Canna indica]
MAMNLDLNSPPEVESLLCEDFPDSRHLWNPGETSLSSVPQSSHATGPQQGTSTSGSDRIGSSIIDLESEDDEVKILSSSGFPQGRNHSRNNQPVTVIIDEDCETYTKQSGEQVAKSSLNTHNKRGRSSASKTLNNNHLYFVVEDEYKTKKKNVMNSEKETEKVTTKEPTLTCPICMETIVHTSSTICGHIFCLRCIKACVQKRKKCPVCGRKLQKNGFHRVYLPAFE